MKHPLLLLVSAFAAFSCFADEGMWLFNDPPRELLKQRYGFDATDDWLAHLQKSSVRFSSGGSGSFVSEDGLLITNQHVGADALQKVSTKEKDYVKEGFRAQTPSEEIKCLDLELNVLQSIEDVTEAINAAVPKGSDPAKAFAARRKIIAATEKESLEKTGLRSNVITLWKGGAYHLYRFKRYTDVRLVFSPEQQVAFFGGDPDNFEFPRQDLDICILRAYENGQPAKVKDFLRFSPTGAREDDLVFVSGHPGKTNRILTLSELISMRDKGMPFTLEMLKRREVLVRNWSERNAENARRAQRDVFGLQNGRKALDGRLAGLLDPSLTSRKRAAEESFKASLAGHPEDGAALAAYDRIATATRILDAQSVAEALLEGEMAFGCNSFHIARTLLRAADERPKPNGERLAEYTDSEKASLELTLFSAKPIYTDLETLKLADSLAFLAGKLGEDDPTVQKILAGKSPRERAAELIDGTTVRDVAVRHRLYEGGAEAVTAARDPMIELARLVDAQSRGLRKVSDEQDEVKQEGHAAIEQARHKLGTASYPDATFTLRLSFGTVKGYDEEGQAVRPLTTIGSLVREIRGKQRSSTLQPRFALEGKGKQPRSQYTAEFCEHQRHHRRQLRQPGSQSGGRIRGSHFRWQPAKPFVGRGL